MNIRTSPLVEGALEAKRPTRWWLAWPLVIVFFLYDPVLFLSSPPASLVKMAPFMGDAWEIVPFGISLGLVALWVTRKEKRPFSSVGFRGPSSLPRLAAGFAGGVAAMTVVCLSLVGIGTYGLGGSPATTTGFAALLPSLLLLIAVGVQATTEEVIFRGYLLQITGAQISAWPTVLLGAFAFAGAHPSGNAIAMTNVLLVALFFTFVSLAQGSIWTAAGFHIGWNWSQGHLLGIPVSGHVRDVSILALGPKAGAAAWLSGGDIGIEASAASTVVLAALAVWSYRYYRGAEAARNTNAQSTVA